ncbi:transposase, partial [Frankia sp. Cj3]
MGRRRGKRKRGKQPGEDGLTLAWREVPDRVERHFPVGDCSCGAGIADGTVAGVARSHQSHDVARVEFAVTQHDLYRVVCGCGLRHVAARPAEVLDASVSYGPEIRAIALYLLVRPHIPVERICELLFEVYQVEVSTGWVHGLLAAGSEAVDPAVREIEERIAAEKVVGFDETPMKIGPKGRTRYVLSVSTGLFTLFMLGRRDLVSFELFLLARMLGVVVHDRYGLYDHVTFNGFLHQLCVAHILRDVRDVIETYPDAAWAPQVARSLTGLVHQASLARLAGLAGVPAALRDPLIEEFRSGVKVGLSEIVPAPKGRKQPVGRCLLECLDAREQDVLRFVFDLDVWATNNQSERDLRPFK